MRKYLFGGSMLVAITGFTQNVVNVDKGTVPLSNRVFYTVAGQPFSSAKYTSVVAGSPFFKDQWMKAALAFDTVSYGGGNLRVKLDLVDNTIVYLNEHGQEMISVSEVNQVSLLDSITGKNYLFEHVPGEGNKWFQVVSIGTLSFYKLHHKFMQETKAYGSSVTEQTIKTEERYYVVFNNKATRIKKPKDMVDLVAIRHSKELAAYIESQKLSGKKESDFVAAVEYYNSFK